MALGIYVQKSTVSISSHTKHKVQPVYWRKRRGTRKVNVSLTPFNPAHVPLELKKTKTREKKRSWGRLKKREKQTGDIPTTNNRRQSYNQQQETVLQPTTGDSPTTNNRRQSYNQQQETVLQPPTGGIPTTNNRRHSYNQQQETVLQPTTGDSPTTNNRRQSYNQRQETVL